MEWASPEVRGYATRIAHHNAWRFRGELDVADLVQEFALAFLKVKRAANPSFGPAAFMLLFKNKVEWTLVSLIRKHVGTGRCDCRIQASMIEASPAEGGSHGGDFTEILGQWEMGGQAELNLIFEEAPEVIRRFIEAKLLGTLQRVRVDGTLEPAKKAIRRFTGMDPNAFYRLLRRWGEDALGLPALG